MKKYFLLLPITYYLLPSLILANTTTAMTTGKVNATVNIQNSIEGSSDATTHIQTDVNGNIETYDSTESAIIYVKNTGSNTTITTNTTSVLSKTPETTLDETTGEKHAKQYTHSLLKNIQRFLKNLLHPFLFFTSRNNKS